MSQTVEDVLRDAEFVLDDDTYRLLKLPPRAISAAAGVVAEIAEPFCVLIVDKDEVSLVIPEEAVEDFASRLRDHELGEAYKLITVDMVLQPDLIGFMARISAALAAAGVGVFPYAAYSRDHILVPAGQVERALDALNALKS